MQGASKYAGHVSQHGAIDAPNGVFPTQNASSIVLL